MPLSSVDRASPFDRLLAGGLIDDLFVAGHPRFDFAPAVLSAQTAGELAYAAAAVAQALDELVARVWQDRALLELLGLDPTRAALAMLSGGAWLGVARADVFLAEDAAEPQVCELNCDTPTGLAEAVEMGRIAREDHPALKDPSAALPARLAAWVSRHLPGETQEGRAVVGLCHPTEMAEDLGHIRAWRHWLEAAGFAVAVGSPFNLSTAADGRAALCGMPCDLVLRHYKTDWWAARAAVWQDEPPPPDADPLHGPLAVLLQAQLRGKTAVLNPWGAGLGQNKRCLALFFERPDLFDDDLVARVRRFVPETRFAENVPFKQALDERERWVLKSAEGCEGEEVFVGRECDAKVWREALTQAVPGQWVLQRAFLPRRDAQGRQANHGVFLVEGRPSGILTRLSHRATDGEAQIRGTLVEVSA